VSLGRVVDRAIDKLTDARKTMHTIQELQRYYEGDGTDPEPQPLEPIESVRAGLAKQRKELKRKRVEARTEANTRRKAGGEVGSAEAALELKRSTASLLAHAGFDGETVSASQADHPRCQ
jgi:transcriptional activator SPT7